MHFDIYAGESVTLPIDLDGTSEDYSLSGAALAFRVSALGGSEALLDVTPDTVDADAGTLEVALSETDTASLAPGVYACQLIETSQPLVLARGTIAVATLIA